jgi:hypothetical protein
LKDLGYLKLDFDITFSLAKFSSSSYSLLGTTEAVKAVFTKRLDGGI